MAWAITTIYTSKCAQMDPQQLPKMSKFYSRCKKCDIEKTLVGAPCTTLVARRLKVCMFNNYFVRLSSLKFENNNIKTGLQKQPRQQKFRAMNGAHLASPIRGELAMVMLIGPSWEPNLLPFWAPNLGSIREPRSLP